MGLGSFSTGFGIGFGVGFISREAVPILQAIIKPIARVSLKTGIKLFEKTREALALLGETTADTIAEVQDELKKDRKLKQSKSKKEKSHAEVSEIKKAA